MYSSVLAIQLSNIKHCNGQRIYNNGADFLSSTSGSVGNGERYLVASWSCIYMAGNLLIVCGAVAKIPCPAVYSCNIHNCSVGCKICYSVNTGMIVNEIDNNTCKYGYWFNNGIGAVVEITNYMHYLVNTGSTEEMCCIFQI